MGPVCPRHLVTAPGRGQGTAQGATDAAEAQAVLTTAVHDGRVVVRELPGRPRSVRLCLPYGRAEADAVAFVVLRPAEIRIAGGPATLVRVRAVDRAQRRQTGREHVAWSPTKSSMSPVPEQRPMMPAV